MTLPPAWRKLALTVHVSASVAWLGAVVTFLVLAIVSVSGADAGLVSAIHVVLAPVGWLVIVPLCAASLLTGLISSLGTHWGLFRHYWVLAKLGINLLATVVLLTYMPALDALARAATTPGATLAHGGQHSPVLHAGGATVLLLAAVVLAVYKPRGTTPLARAARRADRQPAAQS